MTILEREVDLTSDPYASVGYRYRIAELWDRKLTDSTRAVEGFREIWSSLQSTKQRSTHSRG